MRLFSKKTVFTEADLRDIRKKNSGFFSQTDHQLIQVSDNIEQHVKFLGLYCNQKQQKLGKKILNLVEEAADLNRELDRTFTVR